MLWLGVICAALFVLSAILFIKIALLRHAADEIRKSLSDRLEYDTNTLISIGTQDRSMRRLADSMNQDLRLLRKERRRYQNGDLELKEAVTHISHDLRTPLTTICGYLDLLKQEEKSDNATRYLSLIESRTLALKQLTEELFQYSMVASTPEQLSLEALSLNAVLEESIAAFYMAFKKRGIEPSIDLPEQVIMRALHPAAITRVFGNIFSNAIKYSDGDLSISLSTQGEITISNKASGLDDVQVGKLFNRFYTVEAARNASGLGLTIAKTLVEQMNGSIIAHYEAQRLSIILAFPK